MKIAVTGGYSSGKSSVSAVLTTLLDCFFISADIACKNELQVGATGWQQLKELWGPDYFSEDGEVDREAVREKIFLDPASKKELEAILHPLAHRQIVDAGLRADVCDKHLVAEIPLLFESDQSYDFDMVIVVSVAEDIAISRAMRRDDVRASLATSIIASQLPLAIKEARADFIINNDGLFAATYSQILFFVADRIEKKK
ncbi:dephospho-CoA kinase [Desulfotalea psychrophila]|uniref:Dephospho-CoA kinase n=1 Tax=Desulfotalea psychrophila (strain LSv54 / DSM 12343) TaxID=177439 RepID=COAE_DESPS|nr:dephospho-CoA kinase [Desulfotalea psychrophila]Q6AJM2.1 RecName: Full=Dephospho-CoA kinase; AltName: Full=Dephosphocoenzyme A kinase [Desulfotalea psychrophila LSv54]CAG37458.1 conserved hypothetical protein [Desulfotalea psychrophila LSv54]